MIKNKGFSLIDSMVALVLFGSVIYFVAGYQKVGLKDRKITAYESELNRDSLAFSKLVNGPALTDAQVKQYHYRTFANILRNSPTNITTTKGNVACIVNNSSRLTQNCVNKLPIGEDKMFNNGSGLNFPEIGGYDRFYNGIFAQLNLKHFNDLVPNMCIYFDSRDKAYDLYLYYTSPTPLTIKEIEMYKNSALVFGAAAGITDATGSLHSTAGWTMPTTCGTPAIGTAGVYLNLLPSFLSLREDNIKLLTNADDNSMLSFKGNTNTLKTDLYISGSGNDSFLQTGTTTDGQQEFNIGNRKFNDYVMNKASPTLSNLLMLYPTASRTAIPTNTITTTAPKVKFSGVGLVANSSDYAVFMPNETVPNTNISNPYQLYSPCDSTNELGRIVKAGTDFAVCMRHPYCWEFSASSKGVSHTCYMPMNDTRKQVTIAANSAITTFRCNDTTQNAAAATSPYISALPTFSAESVNYEYLKVIENGSVNFGGVTSFYYNKYQEITNNQCLSSFLGVCTSNKCWITHLPQLTSTISYNSAKYANQANCSAGLPGLSGAYGVGQVNGTSTLDGRAFMTKDPNLGGYAWNNGNIGWLKDNQPSTIFHLDGSGEIRSPQIGGTPTNLTIRKDCGIVNVSPILRNLNDGWKPFGVFDSLTKYPNYNNAFSYGTAGSGGDNSAACNNASGEFNSNHRDVDAVNVTLPYLVINGVKQMDNQLKLNGFVNPGDDKWSLLNLTTQDKTNFMHIKVKYLKSNQPTSTSEHQMTGNDSNLNSLDNYASGFTFMPNTGVPNCAYQCQIAAPKLGFSGTFYYHEYANITGYQNTKACVCYNNVGWNGQNFYKQANTNVFLVRPKTNNSNITVKKVSCSANPLYFNTTAATDPQASDKSPYATMSMNWLNFGNPQNVRGSPDPVVPSRKCLSSNITATYTTACNGTKSTALTCTPNRSGIYIGAASYYKTSTGAATCAAQTNTGQKDKNNNWIYVNNTAASTNIYVNCNANSEPSGYYENPSAGQTRSVTWSGSCSSFDK